MKHPFFSKTLILIFGAVPLVLVAQSPVPNKKAPAGMVFVEGGTFKMGSDTGDPDERPVHEVTVGNFYMDIHEVTVEEFKKFIDATGYRTDADKKGMGYFWDGSKFVEKRGVNWKYDENASLRKPEDYNQPVIFVSWNDATAYAKWAGKRLPTEAEWEYAARGGKNSKGYMYSGSDNPDEIGWYKENSAGRSHAVATTKKANELGLYDMSGNVWEWVADNYASDYYSVSPKGNPKGPAIGERKVYKGGSWYIDLEDLRVSDRDAEAPVNSSINIGFRCAKDIAK